MTLIRFVQEQRDKAIERLENMFNALDGGITKKKYLMICEQLGKEPTPEGIQDVINVFNGLGDRVYPDIGYVGKDYTQLPVLFDLYGIEDQRDKEFAIEVLNWLDARAIKKSADQVKSELDKIKRQSRGK